MWSLKKYNNYSLTHFRENWIFPVQIKPTNQYDDMFNSFANYTLPNFCGIFKYV